MHMLTRETPKQFAHMLLSVHPESLAKLRAEHDSVCGATFQGAADMLRNEPHRIAELEYTTAVIKETLRMFPVGFTVRTNSEKRSVSRSLLPTSWLVVRVRRRKADSRVRAHTQRNPTALQRTDVPHGGPLRRPERPHDPLLGRRLRRPQGLQARALPPLGRPHRAQRLAALRARPARLHGAASWPSTRCAAVLLLTARWLDISLANPSPNAAPRTVWTDLDTKLATDAFSELGLESKPRDGHAVEGQQDRARDVIDWPASCLL